MERVVLEHGGAPGWAVLRRLTGADEEQVHDTGSEAAIGLIDRLLVDEPGCAARPGQAAELAVPDRDRLLAAVHRVEFGGRIEATLRCRACDQPFDLDFSLGDLEASLRGPAAPDGIEREAGGVFRLPDGRRFRLPRGTDERAAAAADSPELELLRRCMVEGSAGDDVDRLADAMRAVGPTLDLDVAASCPECRVDQSVRFDVQHYLLRRITDEAPVRLREIHRIASAYGWSLAEILALPRTRRRGHVELIDRDGSPSRWA